MPLGVRERKYLDRTGIAQQREIGDLMRYAALNQDGDALWRLCTRDRAEAAHRPALGV